jgi:putative CocE/NonD family hydrolase
MPQQYPNLPTDIPENFNPYSPAQDYDLIDAMIPMRDGVKLHTLIVISKRIKSPAPVLLTRTPYGANNVIFNGYPTPSLIATLPAWLEDFIDAGYIYAVQDVRGKFKSEGDYVMYRAPGVGENDHVTDTWDTIDWLMKNVPNNNGRAGITGVSYPGYLATIPLLDPHPALRAAVPVNAVIDAWVGDDFFHNGAFRLMELEYFYKQSTSKDNSFKPPYGSYDIFPYFLNAGNAANAAKALLGEGVMPAWERLATHTNYDEVWQRNALDRELAKLDHVPIPTMVVHAWFDAEDIYGPIATHMALKDKGGAPYHFVAGPWKHGQCMGDGTSAGKMRWDSDTSLWFRRNLMLPFFNTHLKDEAPAQPLAHATLFETGVNQWRTAESWPPALAEPRALYLHAGGKLSFEKPAREGTDSFVSDPAKPVPFRVRPIMSRHRDYGQWGEWQLDDQRPVADRPDVLVYVSDVLESPVTIAGDVSATLFSATTGSDADWVVKLIDVFPDEYPRQPELGGFQLMVSFEILRGRFREGFEAAKPIPPNEVMPYDVRMPHAYHTFRRGHRIMVQVHSTWFPLYDRNPQTFVESIFDAPASAYVKATHTVHAGGAQCSCVNVRVL